MLGIFKNIWISLKPFWKVLFSEAACKRATRSATAHRSPNRNAWTMHATKWSKRASRSAPANEANADHKCFTASWPAVLPLRLAASRSSPIMPAFLTGRTMAWYADEYSLCFMIFRSTKVMGLQIDGEVDGFFLRAAGDADGILGHAAGFLLRVL